MSECSPPDDATGSNLLSWRGARMPRLKSGLPNIRNLWPVAVVMIISLLIPLLAGGSATRSLLEKLSPYHLALLALLLSLKWSLNLIRCQLILRAHQVRQGHLKTMALIWIYDAASESTPGGVGGPLTALTILKAQKVPTATIRSMGIMMVTFDAIAILTLASSALAWRAMMNSSAGHYPIDTILIVTVALLLVMVIRKMGKNNRESSQMANTPASAAESLSRRVLKLTDSIKQVVSTLATGNAYLVTSVGVLSIGHWACRLSVIYLAVISVGAFITWPETVLAQIISGISGMLVGLPGGYIGADLALASLLNTKLDWAQVTAVLLIWRLMTFHITVLMGLTSAGVMLLTRKSVAERY